MYKKARSKGYDVRTLKKVVSQRRRRGHGGQAKIQVHDSTVERYHALLE
ncbi:DUF2312 domain-containing protein [Agrobacterium cavarae]|uniref:GapR-like DNA-binding domain-containing protein n=2 Tax=Rhizobium/Agrobacterium group TaxID=227290 RepID=A0AA92BZN5_RHIRH|nr:hypothetical protein DC430_22650 [Rhizobium rhizogenes]PVE62557.1 hypothetical protein DC415_21565 [Agrobacterium tumefaciens]PVE70695.1 hypothetical protein DCP16_21565 [Sphingomonas sp. TPD3009]TBN14841.1 DUF2312 domain-containing protein [Agrobacterium cavarae]